MNDTTYITIALAIIFVIIILVIHRRQWMPEVGEAYWYRHKRHNAIMRSTWQGRELDFQRLVDNNVFKDPKHVPRG